MEISVCTSTHSRFSSDHFLSSCSSRDRPLSGDEVIIATTHTTLSHQPTRAANRQASRPLTGATLTACSLESRRVDGGGDGGSSVDSFEGKVRQGPSAQAWGVPTTAKTDADVSDLQPRHRRLLLQHVSTNQPPKTG
jgi:hypothetical protein